jgi:adenylylsulfate kinase
MNYLFPFNSRISYEQRKTMMMQEPRLIWLTGLSGSGKSTLALRLEHYLFHNGFKVFLLDGDNVRNGLNKDLGFSESDRKENLRRVGEMAKVMLDAGLIVICAFISPYEKERQAVKQIIGPERFTEVHVNCCIEVCESRDTKGLYAKARKGIIPDFTGISAPYEPPASPDVLVNTHTEDINESLLKIIQVIESKIIATPTGVAISGTQQTAEWIY